VTGEARRRRVRYAAQVEHSGISPTAVMFLAFVVVGVGMALFLRYDKRK
jgi:hypothetical protein